MNENRIEGAAKIVVGEVESAAGATYDDVEMRVRGAARQVDGHVQEVLGSIQETLEDVADHAKSVVSTAGDAYGRISDAANDVAWKVDPFVHERPYIALALCTAVGLLAGLLFAGRGPKIVYVRPRA